MKPATAVLRDPATIRQRAINIAVAVEAGKSRWFRIDASRIGDAVSRVAQITRERYPDLNIPYHSRWRHFEAGGVDRTGGLLQTIVGLDRAEQARCRIDLAMISVLLDTGAGNDWSYLESDARGRDFRYVHAEGLGIASFRAFMAGIFSSDPARPLRVDGKALERLDLATLSAVFQLRGDNRLAGVEARLERLRRAGQCLRERRAVFGAGGRPGGLFDFLTRSGTITELPATAMLRAVLDNTSDIATAGLKLGGDPLGDCWPHQHAGGDGESAGWMPFHKLPQWLVYSLFEPFEWAGITITGRDALTALPEYRNGGLLLDTGVIALRDPSWADIEWVPGDELVIEWRALTIALIDRIADGVRRQLGLDEHKLPLACVLEGGTWATGRALAAEKRRGQPPLRIESDGTLF